jgi:uncharacterized membrane protein YhaH (DUF805 family)
MTLVWLLKVLLNPEVVMTEIFITIATPLAFMLISILRRLENIGKSKLWFLGLFLPFINLYALPMIFSCPPNVKENGMDKEGYFIFFLVLIMAIALMVLMALGFSLLTSYPAPRFRM